jgi:hypothetical protein
MSVQVVLEGIAHNAKSGAIVLVTDGEHDVTFYIGGLDSWDDALLRKRVRVTGVLVRRKLAPDPSEGPIHSAGMYGDSTVVDQARWELIAG